MFTRRITLAAAAAFALAGCASTSAPVTVAETIATTPSLSTLNELVLKAGLTDTLKSAGPFTVFAPTNDAFKGLTSKTMGELGNDPEKLKAVLTYHVVAAKTTAAEVKNGNVKTVNGANIGLSKAGNYVTVEDALVQQADIVASNGVVHTVDRVLMPPAKR